MIFYLFLLALVPPLLVMIMLFFSDRFEKEPLHRLFFCIAGGVLVTIPIMLMIKWFPAFYSLKFNSDTVSAFFSSFVHAGLIEETLKFLVVYFLAVKSRFFNEPFDAVVYYAAVAVGFAVIENLQYIIMGSQDALNFGHQTGTYSPFLHVSALMAVVRSLPAHMVFAGLSSHFVARYKFRKPVYARKWLWLAWGSGVFVHGCFNFFLQMLPGSVATVAAASWLFLIAGLGVLLNIPLLLNSPFNRARRMWSRKLREEARSSEAYSRWNGWRFIFFTLLFMGVVIGTFYLNRWIVTG